MMRAIAIDPFGGIDALTSKTMPVPEIGPDEVLVRLEFIGVAACAGRALSESVFKIPPGIRTLGLIS
ncbi:MAG TPA: hypothetical protein VE871_14420 [Longimicrobium sp.]|nr:hypothetical protein [Longimicrobium sp.]